MAGDNGHSENDNPMKAPVLRPENVNPQRLISPNLQENNPGIRLISNEERLPDMLKAVYIPDEKLAFYISMALGECQEFLYDEDGKPDPKVEERIESIKYLLASLCSVGGRFADAYKQAATGVLTNAYSERRGWALLNIPSGRTREDRDDTNHKQPGKLRN